ncbi:hypothetical protein LOH54_04895 [Sulfurimonas sp. HSL-3221]|uniref:hypothetical protein n=1 Tax=Sulfurimonadaceae TaxID=2771471 RepID=UPI001E2CD412|nr:hypothetical protein [Sulfurimonas sp. HSL-3221]UFS63469.1 hypothetical protein LOH54_04895 [Sulfurimonas sp. HSL-3221]
MKKLLVLSLVLLLSIAVQATQKLENITTMNEFQGFVHTFYLHPQPELIDSAITFLGSSEMASNPNAKALLLMSFSSLFSMYDATRKTQWEKTIQGIREPAKSLLMDALRRSPSALLDAAPLSPAKVDMYWACFFTTGDFEYLYAIIALLKHLDERQDINLFLTAASAKWSLSSNAKIHFKVRMALEAMKAGDLPALQAVAKEILEVNPTLIREEALAVLREQKRKGIWR